MWQDGPNGEAARRPPKPPSVNLPSGTAHLLYELDKVLLFWLRDGRTFIGVLKSLDQFGNVVVSGTIERIYVGTEYGDIERGICKLALMLSVDCLIEQFYCLFSTVNDIDRLIDWSISLLSLITIVRLIDWLDSLCNLSETYSAGILRGENLVLVGEWDSAKEQQSGTRRRDIQYILTRQMEEEEKKLKVKEGLQKAMRERGLNIRDDPEDDLFIK